MVKLIFDFIEKAKEPLKAYSILFNVPLKLMYSNFESPTPQTHFLNTNQTSTAFLITNRGKQLRRYMEERCYRKGEKFLIPIPLSAIIYVPVVLLFS